MMMDTFALSTCVAVHAALLLLVLFSPVVSSVPVLSQPVDNTACDWNVWDDTTEVKGVQKISTRCAEGQVTWRTPYGGLAITFAPPLTLASHFALCFTARSAFVTLRLLLEGNQSLSLLAVLDPSRPRLRHEICLNSTVDRPITIYAEADSSASSPVLGRAVLEYDSQALAGNAAGSHEQDCSPCVEEEILLAVCASDYAIIGRIHSTSSTFDDVVDDDDSGEADVIVYVSRVIRQRMVVGDSLDGRFDRDGRNLMSRLVIADDRRSRLGRPASQYMSITVPRKCHARQGEGLFLFTGRMRLGKARLGCAPRLEEFQRMWENAVAAGTNPCMLK